MHALVLAALAASVAVSPPPARIVRVQLVPFVEPPAPGPPAAPPAAAPRPPVPAPRPAAARPRPASPPRVAAKPKPAAPPAAPSVAPAPSEAVAGGEAAPGPVSSAPPTGGGGAGGVDGRGAAADEMAAYVARVRELLNRHKQYPALARRRGLEGTVLVQLRIDADGAVQDARADGGAPRLFARSALEAIERAGRFPSPPHGGVAIEVPMRFRLED